MSARISKLVPSLSGFGRGETAAAPAARDITREFQQFARDHRPTLTRAARIISLAGRMSEWGYIHRDAVVILASRNVTSLQQLEDALHDGGRGGRKSDEIPRYRSQLNVLLEASRRSPAAQGDALADALKAMRGGEDALGEVMLEIIHNAFDVGPSAVDGEWDEFVEGSQRSIAQYRIPVALASKQLGVESATGPASTAVSARGGDAQQPPTAWSYLYLKDSTRALACELTILARAVVKACCKATDAAALQKEFGNVAWALEHTSGGVKLKQRATETGGSWGDVSEKQAAAVVDFYRGSVALLLGEAFRPGGQESAGRLSAPGRTDGWDDAGAPAKVS